MKKNLFDKLFLLAGVTMLASACIIDDPVAGPVIGGGGSDDPDDPSVEVFITPDGDFSDWDAIPEDELAVSEVPADAFYPTGRKVMAYAGETFINLYVEFKNQADMPVQIMHLYIDSDMAFDGEGNPTTGMGNPAWTNDGSDLLFEGYVIDEESGEACEYDPTIFSFSGTPLSGDWEWTDAVLPGLGVCKKSPHKVLSNGNTAFEMTIVRSAVPNLGKKFRLGVGLQYDWNDIAYLPAGSAVDKNGTLEHGPVQNLLVGEKKTVGAADIAIDGDFADWEALPASDVTVAVTPADAFYPGGKVLKVASNTDYLYLYVEFDGSDEVGVGILDLFLDIDMAFDADGKPTTGTGNWAWTNNGCDLMFQGEIEGWDPEGFMYSGTPLGDEWAWTSVVAPGTGAVTTSSTVTLDNGHKAVEIGILRSAIPNLGKKTKLGILLEKGDWSGECGVLPALPTKHSDAGDEFDPAGLMSVTLF